MGSAGMSKPLKETETHPCCFYSPLDTPRIGFPPFLSHPQNRIPAKVPLVPNKERTKGWASFGGRAIEEGGYCYRIKADGRRFSRCLVDAK